MLVCKSEGSLDKTGQLMIYVLSEERPKPL